MRWTDLPLQPADRALRQFALLCLIVFGALAVWQAAAHQRMVVAVGMALIAVAVGAVGMIAPRAIRLVYVGWMVAAFPLAWLISRLSLVLAFYLVVTPLAVCSRIVRRDPLALRPADKKESFWARLDSTTKVARYFRQYL